MADEIARPLSKPDGGPRSTFGDLALGRLPALALRLPIRAYRYSLSMLFGRRCRYLPTCSEFADEAIARHGAWAGGWIAAGRVCRCHPWGGDGYDPVLHELPTGASWSRPWRYGQRAPAPVCEAVSDPLTTAEHRVSGVDRSPVMPASSRVSTTST